MKKLLIISTLFLFFGAVACEDDNDVEPQDIVAQGIVENPQVTAWQYGTHILVSEDDSIMYALKSSAINLDDYIDEEVEIYGRLIAGYPVDTGPEYVEVITLDRINL
jgi:hypothetical protein